MFGSRIRQQSTTFLHFIGTNLAPSNRVGFFPPHIRLILFMSIMRTACRVYLAGRGTAPRVQNTNSRDNKHNATVDSSRRTVNDDDANEVLEERITNLHCIAQLPLIEFVSGDGAELCACSTKENWETLVSGENG